MGQKEEIYNNIRSTGNYSWRINYRGAVCKFESSSPEDAVVYHLEVPTDVRNKGIGTDLIIATQRFLIQNTDIHTLYAQIGEESGATEHILRNKLGFEILQVEERETIGTIVDAQKKIQ